MSILETIVTNAISALHPVVSSTDARKSYQLEQFRGRDYSDMRTELRRIISRNTQIHLRHVALTARASVDLAPQYQRRPMVALEGVTNAVRDRLLEYRRDLAWEEELLDAEQACVGQQSYILAILPDPETGEIELLKFLPYDYVDIQFSGRVKRRLRDASYVELAVPLSRNRTVSMARSLTARLVLTPTQAYYRYPDGERIGVYNDEQSNPLGYLPLVGSRLARPADRGLWPPHLSDDIWSIDVGLCVGLSDMEAILRVQGWAREEFNLRSTGQTAKRRIPASPYHPVVTKEDESYKVHGVSPPTDKYAAALLLTTRLWAAYRNLSPEGYQGLTGDAKELDRVAALAEREINERRCERVEREATEILVDTHNVAARSALTLRMPDMSVGYHYVEPRTNDLQRAQSRELRMAQGLDDAVLEIQQLEGVSEKKAVQIWEQRLERRRRMLELRGDAAVSGVDEIGKQTGEPGRPTNPRGVDGEKRDGPGEGAA